MKNEILKNINKILKENFKFKKNVNFNTNLLKIKNWDSLKHLDFIMCLETHFDIKFKINENYQIILIKDFVKIVEKKIK